MSKKRLESIKTAILFQFLFFLYRTLYVSLFWFSFGFYFYSFFRVEGVSGGYPVNKVVLEQPLNFGCFFCVIVCEVFLNFCYEMVKRNFEKMAKHTTCFVNFFLVIFYHRFTFSNPAGSSNCEINFFHFNANRHIFF